MTGTGPPLLFVILTVWKSLLARVFLLRGRCKGGGWGYGHSTHSGSGESSLLGQSGGGRVSPGHWFSDFSVTQSSAELITSERWFGGPGFAVLTSSQVTLMEPLVRGLMCWQ